MLLGLGVAVLRGQWQLSKTTIEETDAQDFGIFHASVRNAVSGKGLYRAAASAASWRRTTPGS